MAEMACLFPPCGVLGRPLARSEGVRGSFRFRSPLVFDLSTRLFLKGVFQRKTAISFCAQLLFCLPVTWVRVSARRQMENTMPCQLLSLLSLLSSIRFQVLYWHAGMRYLKYCQSKYTVVYIQTNIYIYVYIQSCIYKDMQIQYRHEHA